MRFFHARCQACSRMTSAQQQRLLPRRCRHCNGPVERVSEVLGLRGEARFISATRASRLGERRYQLATALSELTEAVALASQTRTAGAQKRLAAALALAVGVLQDCQMPPLQTRLIAKTIGRQHAYAARLAEQPPQEKLKQETASHDG